MRFGTLLKDRHRGEQCVLVANGPSLNSMDLSFLNHQICIGMNKIYLGFRKFNFYPNYYVAVNPNVIQQSISDIRNLSCVKFIGNRNGALLEEDALTYMVNTNNPPSRFCKDISQGVREGGTVTFAALQVAYYLGFKRVIIIGMDHSFQYEGRPNESRVMDGVDPNHFTPGYFGFGQTWDNPDLEKSEESYRLARDMYETEGREIIDATLNGKCSVFKKVNYEDYFNIAKG